MNIHPTILIVGLAAYSIFGLTLATTLVVISARMTELVKTCYDIANMMERESRRRDKIWKSRKIRQSRDPKYKPQPYPPSPDDTYRPKPTSPQDLEQAMSKMWPTVR